MGSSAPAETPGEMFSFSLLGCEASLLTARLGRLAIAGRKPIETPHYLPTSSRGVVPHTTHDVMRDHMPVGGLYLALEDFIEKGASGAIPPIYTTPKKSSESALRKFISCPDDVPLVLGPRRVPPITTTTPNAPNSIAILTSVGFRQLETEQYIEAINKLQPDIVVGLSDLVAGQQIGVKRKEKMVDRTHAWTRDALSTLYDSSMKTTTTNDFQPLPRTRYFAPLLPLDPEEQLLYVQDLEDELREHVSGFASYDASALAAIPKSMADLIRLSLAQPRTPHEILREVSLGTDVTIVPSITEATDAGFALDFEFPGPASENRSGRRALAVDMWSSTHSTSLSPLAEGCQCYTCQKHHRAYIRHLLNAKEMLAWTLLQIHNNYVMNNFFASIRQRISNGSFEQDVQTFERAYENEFPQQTGKGPRVRGYQVKTECGSQKKNPPGHGRLDMVSDRFTPSDSSAVTPDAESQELQDRGFAEKAE